MCNNSEKATPADCKFWQSPAVFRSASFLLLLGLSRFASSPPVEPVWGAEGSMGLVVALIILLMVLGALIPANCHIPFYR